jgi:hypothetical protein
VPPTAAEAGPHGFAEFILHIVPDNFVGAFTKGELLQVVVLAVLLALLEPCRKQLSHGQFLRQCLTLDLASFPMRAKVS